MRRYSCGAVCELRKGHLRMRTLAEDNRWTEYSCHLRNTLQHSVGQEPFLHFDRDCPPVHIRDCTGQEDGHQDGHSQYNTSSSLARFRQNLMHRKDTHEFVHK